MRFRLLAVFVFLTVGIGGPCEAQTKARLAVEPAPQLIENFLRAEMQKRGIPGMQVAVVHHGKIVLQGDYGLANVEHSVPVTNDTVFAVHSITKAFVGVAMMQLVEAGKVDLAAPVSHYLDGLPEAWRAITIKQLLTHTSGLPDIWDNDARQIDYDDVAWAKVLGMPVQFAPGERFQYTQTNYILLGKIINKLSGEPFTDFIRDRQFNVVGMPHTGFGDSHDVIPHMAATGICGMCMITACGQNSSRFTSVTGLHLFARRQG
jgi:CubicO group peptidase (beta-lactamase class C family)